MKKVFPLALLFFCSVVSASTYYLSPVGDDTKGNGSKNYPWFTLERVWEVVAAGDTVYMRGGTYEYRDLQLLKGKSGTADNYIYVWAYSSEIPLITSHVTFPASSELIYAEGNYLYWKGLEIANHYQLPGEDDASGIRFNNTNHSIFELINYHHNASAFKIWGESTDNLILNCDFHHNYDPYSSNAYADADGLNISYITAGSVNTVKGCRFYYNSDDGIDLWNNEGEVVIDSCWSWRNGYREDGITAGGDGAGFKLGKTTTTDYTFYKRILSNNLSISNRNFGISQNAATCKMFICNNILYDNKQIGIYFSPAWGDASHVISNNISYKNATDAAIGIKLPVVTHNSWQPGVTLTDDDFISLDMTQLVRPRKPNGNLPDIDFMHLADGSDLIDAGIDVGLPYYGKAPDIGAFEAVAGDFHLNKLPVVTISFPTKGTSFESPATITVDVEAYDPDGSISKVELYNGSKKLAEMTVAPYSFTLKNLPAGSYNLKAVATDNLNTSAVSAALEVSVVALQRKK